MENIKETLNALDAASPELMGNKMEFRSFRGGVGKVDLSDLAIDGHLICKAIEALPMLLRHYEATK